MGRLPIRARREKRNADSNAKSCPEHNASNTGSNAPFPSPSPKETAPPTLSPRWGGSDGIGEPDSQDGFTESDDSEEDSLF